MMALKTSEETKPVAVVNSSETGKEVLSWLPAKSYVGPKHVEISFCPESCYPIGCWVEYRL